MDFLSRSHFTLPHILNSNACCQQKAAGRLEEREPSLFLGVPARKQECLLLKPHGENNPSNSDRHLHKNHEHEAEATF